MLFPAVAYPTYEMGALLAGLRPVPVPVDERWRLDVSQISADDAAGTRKAWDKGGRRQFTILSDPGAKVARLYGLVHAQGGNDPDIAIRTTLLVDAA